MRKLFFFISFIAVLVFAVIPSSVAAAALGESSVESSQGISLEEDKMILPPGYPVPGGQKMPFGGENHWYSVVFRGNGEAVVTLRVALYNTNEDGTPLSKVWLRLPEIIPSDISAYQIITQGYCIRYMDRQIYEGPYNPDVYNPPRCIQYSEPDYFNYYSGGKYQKVKYEYSGDTLVINLPTAIQPEKSGSFFVYFRSMGIAKKNLLGAYKYTFESLKTENPINSLTVGISTDSDLHLKGVKGEVDYRFDTAPAMMKMEAGGAAVSNAMIDRAVSQVGQGTLVKNASNLAPLESYKVKGTYADSRLKLYSKELVSGLGIILITLAVILLIINKIFRMMSPGKTSTTKTVQKSSVKEDKVKLIFISLGISLISSLVLGGYSILLIAFYGYLNYVNYQLAQLLRVATVIFSFCIYTTLLFIPGFYFGYKKGAGWGVLTVLLTVFWLFIYFIQLKSRIINVV